MSIIFFPNTDHVTIPRRLELLLCSFKRRCAIMKMSIFEIKYPPGYRYVICIGKTTSASEKGLLRAFIDTIFWRRNEKIVTHNLSAKCGGLGIL